MIKICQRTRLSLRADNTSYTVACHCQQYPPCPAGTRAEARKSILECIHQHETALEMRETYLQSVRVDSTQAGRKTKFLMRQLGVVEISAARSAAVPKRSLISWRYMECCEGGKRCGLLLTARVSMEQRRNEMGGGGGGGVTFPSKPDDRHVFHTPKSESDLAEPLIVLLVNVYKVDAVCKVVLSSSPAAASPTPGPETAGARPQLCRQEMRQHCDRGVREGDASSHNAIGAPRRPPSNLIPRLAQSPPAAPQTIIGLHLGVYLRDEWILCCLPCIVLSGTGRMDSLLSPLYSVIKDVLLLRRHPIQGVGALRDRRVLTPAYKAFHCDNCGVFTSSDVLYRHNKTCKGNVCRLRGSASSSITASQSRLDLAPDNTKLDFMDTLAGWHYVIVIWSDGGEQTSCRRYSPPHGKVGTSFALPYSSPTDLLARNRTPYRSTDRSSDLQTSSVLVWQPKSELVYSQMSLVIVFPSLNKQAISAKWLEGSGGVKGDN
ncbi:hypothetical protein PR048_028281 [Dryococelus australis]|uniref:Uncharacterized protein n=1 Tax=Dryococelus australis TaxID=614101 RepID=A0ABQ9GIQ7_9NEOP|nr:hypothetical protein PR048_028281 [Dryococelus australis]